MVAYEELANQPMERNLMDPAWIAVLGVGVGALIGFAGTWMTAYLNRKSQAEERESRRRASEKDRADRYVLALAPVLAGASLLIEKLQVEELVGAAGSNDEGDLDRLQQVLGDASLTLADMRPQILELAFQAPTDNLFGALWGLNLELPSLYRQISKACRSYVFEGDPGRVEDTAKETWVRATEALDSANEAAANLRRIDPSSVVGTIAG